MRGRSTQEMSTITLWSTATVQGAIQVCDFLEDSVLLLFGNITLRIQVEMPPKPEPEP